MKAISVQQPFAWAILYAGKDVENRTWRTKYRGQILIHASKGFYAPPREWSRILPPGVAIPDPKLLQRGGIVGIVEIIDCVPHHSSPWFFGPWGWVLSNPQPLPFLSCRGMLGFFDPDRGRR